MMQRNLFARLSWPALVGGLFILSALRMLETPVFAQSEFQPTAVPQLTVMDEGTTTLTTRSKLNFSGEGVTCVDNATNQRTDCTVPQLGYTTSSGGVTRPTNASDHFAVGSGGSGTAPLFFNQLTGQLEINVAGGGIVTDADATLGGKLVLQESTAKGTETFTLGVSDDGLASSATCTLQSNGTWLPAECPFNLSVGELSNVTETSISTNDVLTWSGSAWVNQAAQGAGTFVQTQKIFLSAGGEPNCAALPAAYDAIQCFGTGASTQASLTALGMTGTVNQVGSTVYTGSYMDLVFTNAGKYIVQVETKGRESDSTTAPHAWCLSAWLKRGSAYPSVTEPTGYSNALAAVGDGTSRYFGFQITTRVWDVQANDQIVLYGNSCINTGNSSGQLTTPNTVIGTTTIYGAQVNITRLQ